MGRETLLPERGRQRITVFRRVLCAAGFNSEQAPSGCGVAAECTAGFLARFQSVSNEMEEMDERFTRTTAVSAFVPSTLLPWALPHSTPRVDRCTGAWRFRRSMKRSLSRPLVAVTEVTPRCRTDAPMEPSAGREGFRGRTGLLLVNIGTPSSTSVPDVREYLRQFLGDDRVVDLQPRWVKRVLLRVLLATRPAKSAEAYANIWDAERGSPLLFYSEDLAAKLQTRLGARYQVAVGMQFGEPNLRTAMQHFRRQGVDRVVLAPMFPQYASSTTGSAVEMVYRAAAECYVTPYVHTVPAFYDHPAYIETYARQIERHIGARGARTVEHLLISFHGVPESHCERTDDTGLMCMRREDCCAQLRHANRNCYRAQCFVTARLLAQQLQLDPAEYTVSFQSRLTAAGPEWIKPYTDVIIEALARERGIRRLAVVVPSFVADCLETLEEIGIEGRNSFLEAGGETYTLVPCVNASDEWAEAFVRILRDACWMEP
eukprot:ctg_1132.g360